MRLPNDIVEQKEILLKMGVIDQEHVDLVKWLKEYSDKREDERNQKCQ